MGLIHGQEEPENVLIAYLVAVEALRAGKQAAFWLTKDGVNIAFEGYAAGLKVEDAPSIEDLHTEFIERGGRFITCPVCVKLRGLADQPLVDGAEIAGVPRMLEFTSGGALVFNY